MLHPTKTASLLQAEGQEIDSTLNKAAKHVPSSFCPGGIMVSASPVFISR